MNVVSGECARPEFWQYLTSGDAGVSFFIFINLSVLRNICLQGFFDKDSRVGEQVGGSTKVRKK